MLLMVAPVHLDGAGCGRSHLRLVGLFALSTAWFVWLAIDALRGSDRRGGLHFSGHAAMFAAMTWHLAAMAVMASRGQDLPAWTHGWVMAAQSMPGGTLWVFALVGLP